MFTVAAPSITWAVTPGSETLELTFSMQSRRSDFLTNRILPKDDSEGGSG